MTPWSSAQAIEILGDEERLAGEEFCQRSRGAHDDGHERMGPFGSTEGGADDDPKVIDEKPGKRVGRQGGRRLTG